ncbi:hypothetical protein [Marispirochaeta aestuarii]|uniref:hypothetical protein n=1 Tax=Marispirochaeta aestuarii TaxID=1963862 RepID=UPI0029C71B78|nr:hypothetical protein [Marispirochaeta aestuarii]
MMKERFYPADCAAFPAGREEVLVRNRNSCETLILPAAQYGFFRFLTGCVSLDAHLETLVQANRYGLALDVLRRLLTGWVKSGLLRPEALLSAEKKSSKDHKRGGLSAAVITADRPESLKKWLESRIRHQDFLGPRIPLYVFDGSGNPDTAKRNRKITADLGKDYPGPLVYFGEEEKRLLRDSLAAACSLDGISPQLLDFALYGPADGAGFVRTGANRNTALLAVGGGRTWYSDDDLYYRILSHPGAVREGRRFDAGGYSQLKFFASLTELRDYAVALEDYDLPGEIMSNLGRSLEIHEAADEDLTALSPETARVIEGGEALIGAVSTGYCGARWFTDSFFIDSQRYFSDDDIYLHKSRYSASVLSGLNIHTPRMPVVRDGLNLQGGSLALEGTLELPAWFPLDRQEDSCFGMLFLACNRQVRTMYLPAALYHDPEVDKPDLSGTDRDLLPGPGRMNHIILGDIVRQFVSESAEGRLQEAAQKYNRTASLGQASFREYLRAQYTKYSDSRIEFIERLLDIYNAEPGWWAESLASYRDTLTSDIKDPLAGLPGGYQEWLKLYGELLEAWPVIRERAASPAGENQLC